MAAASVPEPAEAGPEPQSHGVGETTAPATVLAGATTSRQTGRRYRHRQQTHSRQTDRQAACPEVQIKKNSSSAKHNKINSAETKQHNKMHQHIKRLNMCRFMNNTYSLPPDRGFSAPYPGL